MTRCTLKSPIECWQYTRQEKHLPLWALAWLAVEDDGCLVFRKPGGTDEDCHLELTDWLVLVSEQTVLCFSHEEFQKAFGVVP
jgi:hypothetical protein